MVGKQETFEVHACREDRWQIDTTAATQADAEAAARKILGRPGVTGVRVIREIAQGGTARENVVFEQTRQIGGGGKIFVNEIDEAPFCEAAGELYVGSGRQTINRLFRAYLDKTVVPILLQALAECSKERPEHPVEFVANYLLANNPEKKQ